jgi:DNA-binding response OmpR family regulator/DNA-binding CsgD family transcriptional regulator
MDGTGGGRGMNTTILIVDDDPDARAMLREAVTRGGLLARVAADGGEALALLEGFTPDLILLDAMMPGLDGFETCRRIKAREDTAHIPVIFMTGLSETEHVVQGLAAGGVDYVTKPLVLDELMARVQVHLGNARTTRGALAVLDSAGGRLMATDVYGHLRWATPEAQRLLDRIDAQEMVQLASLLAACAALPDGQGDAAAFASSSLRLSFLYLGPAANGEHLFSMTRSIEGVEAQMLQGAFGLTPREADVLLWTARGKANKDISDILNISARTVNKHLEQVFVKMGVENRASAAAAATRILMSMN